MIGWHTQEEESRRKCDAVYVDMTSKSGKKSNHFFVSKALSTFLKHSKKKYLFNASGTVDLGSTFAELDRNNPVRLRMKAQDVAGLLLCNDKGRFQIEISTNTTMGSELVQIKEIQVKS